jgi:GTP pyrophosphokinase
MINHPPKTALEMEPQEEIAPLPVEDIHATLVRILTHLTTYRPQADVELVRQAFAYACDKHKMQVRRSGEPYIIHPVAVAEILTDLELDEQSLAAALLHDVIEDCHVTREDLEAHFGEEVANLVDGVTKLQIAGVDEGKREDTQEDNEPLSQQAIERRKRQTDVAKNAANLRKILFATAKDLRVILIKLADRLHNMRTLDSLPPARRFRMATETLQIFAPLAHRLGIWQLKWQLEDLAFKYSDPEEYERVAQLLRQSRGDRQNEVEEARAILQQRLIAEGVEASIQGRPKHFFSIYNKMKQQGLEFSDLFDLIALRVVVHTRNECYHVLGIVSALWNPIPGMYTDYIAQSKSNMYQSLHIKVMGPHDKPLEVQIRTWEMHRTAEFGVAAHWQYKEGGKVSDQFERRLSFLRQQLFDWRAENRDPNDFMRNVTEDLFTDQIFVNTPKGDVLDLPMGSTPIDFAYRVHSAVGDHYVGAKVNGRMVSTSFTLTNGDCVEIITRPNANPSRDWLAVVKTSHARNKIKAYFKRQTQAENIAQGRTLLEKELVAQIDRNAQGWGDEPRSLIKEDRLLALAPQFNMHSTNELFAAIGYGTIAPLTVLNKLRPTPVELPAVRLSSGRANESKIQIMAGGQDVGNVLFRRSLCCLPIPGDDVVGYVTRGTGMALHRKECPNIRHYLEKERDRCMPVEYMGNENQVFKVYINIDTLDRTGLLADVTNVFGENKTNITAIKTQSHRDKTATMELAIEVRNTEHLDAIIQKIYTIGDVIDVHRANNRRDDSRIK